MASDPRLRVSVNPCKYRVMFLEGQLTYLAAHPQALRGRRTRSCTDCAGTSDASQDPSADWDPVHRHRSWLRRLSLTVSSSEP